MRSEKNILFPVACILTLGVFFCGCTVGSSEMWSKKHDPNNNPESGMLNWIAAMNDQNAVRLYELSPNTIKNKISREDFLKTNENNIYFIKNVTFIDYKIYNTSQNNKNATIEAELVMAILDPMTGNVSYTPIFFTFNEYFENNEWKVWATGFEPYKNKKPQIR